MAPPSWNGSVVIARCVAGHLGELPAPESVSGEVTTFCPGCERTTEWTVLFGPDDPVTLSS